MGLRVHEEDSAVHGLGSVAIILHIAVVRVALRLDEDQFWLGQSGDDKARTWDCIRRLVG